jgi:hypothetical protein
MFGFDQRKDGLGLSNLKQGRDWAMRGSVEIEQRKAVGIEHRNAGLEFSNVRQVQV